MADEKDELSESAGENCEKSSDVMRCCGKECRIYVCIECYSLFHKSCADRMKGLKILDENKVICCKTSDKAGNKNNVNNGDTKETELETLKLLTKCEKMEIENRYLRELVEETKDKNNILKLNNELLINRMESIEKNQQSFLLRRPWKANLQGNAEAESERENRDGNNGGTRSQQVRKETTTQSFLQVAMSNMTDPAVTLTGNRKGVATAGNTNGAAKYVRCVDEAAVGQMSRPQPQTSIVNSKQNMVVQARSTNTSDRDQESEDGDRNNMVINAGMNRDNDFKIVQRRRRRYRKNLGTAEVSAQQGQQFEGGDRKAWIYLYRVKRNATEEVIKNYITGKPDFEPENVMVKEIPTEEKQLKCFVVTAPLKKKDELYDPNFWPLHVGIKRFDFNRHKDFLKTAGDFFAK